MSPELQEITFALLRLSLDAESLDSFLNRVKDRPLSKEDWAAIYDFCKKQTIIGVVLVGVNKLPEALRPPRVILDKWICQGFYIQRDNIRFNAMCAKITKMFMDRGLHPIILKGQANASLYPDPLSRQCGDIDVLVEGGKKNVIKHLTEMGLMAGAEVDFHHVHVNPELFDGISVEVHFVAVTCIPLGKGRRLLKFLRKNVQEQSLWNESEGFFFPSMEFALMMQLSHIRRHFIGDGIGLRQLVDYYMLLVHATPAELDESRRNLVKYGLKNMGETLMYALKSLFNLDEHFALCKFKKKWGEELLDQVSIGGNFGKFNEFFDKPMLKKFFYRKKNFLNRLVIDPYEDIWFEMCYWLWIVRGIPKRIKQHKLSLRKKTLRLVNSSNHLQK